MFVLISYILFLEKGSMESCFAKILPVEGMICIKPWALDRDNAFGLNLLSSRITAKVK